MNKLAENWEEVCKIVGIKEAIPFDVSMLPSDMQNYLISAYKLPYITKALNGDWGPDYNDYNQPKFELWFEVKADAKRKSGFGLSYLVYDCWISFSTVGVRLCFKDRKTAQHAWANFKKEYEHFILIIK